MKEKPRWVQRVALYHDPSAAHEFAMKLAMGGNAKRIVIARSLYSPGFTINWMEPLDTV